MDRQELYKLERKSRGEKEQVDTDSIYTIIGEVLLSVFGLLFLGYVVFAFISIIYLVIHRVLGNL